MDIVEDLYKTLFPDWHMPIKQHEENIRIGEKIAKDALDKVFGGNSE
jgi:hypothetical protein